MPISLAGNVVATTVRVTVTLSVHTVGIGGDSEVRFDDDGGLVVGPRRTMPLSLLGHLYPDTLETVRALHRRSTTAESG